MTVVADTTATAARSDARRRPRRARSDPGRGQRHVQRDRQAGRADQGDRHGPLREPRPDQHQPHRRAGASCATGVRGPFPDARRRSPCHAPSSSGLTIFPARASVKVTAVEAARTATSTPNTITIVPSGENSFFLKVTNPERDHRRRRSTEFTPRDPGRTSRGAGRAQPVAPAGVPGGDGRSGARGRGSTVFPSTGQLGERHPPSRPTPWSARRSTTFDLGLSARRARSSPSTTAPVRRIAETADPGGGRRPVTSWSRTRPRSTSARRSSSARRSASRSRRRPSRSRSSTRRELKAMVLGKRIDEARAILAPFGQVELTSRPTGPARSRASRAGSR